MIRESEPEKTASWVATSAPCETIKVQTPLKLWQKEDVGRLEMRSDEWRRSQSSCKAFCSPSEDLLLPESYPWGLLGQSEQLAVQHDPAAVLFSTTWPLFRQLTEEARSTSYHILSANMC